MPSFDTTAQKRWISRNKRNLKMKYFINYDKQTNYF